MNTEANKKVYNYLNTDKFVITLPKNNPKFGKILSIESSLKINKCIPLHNKFGKNLIVKGVYCTNIIYENNDCSGDSFHYYVELPFCSLIPYSSSLTSIHSNLEELRIIKCASNSITVTVLINIEIIKKVRSSKGKTLNSEAHNSKTYSRCKYCKSNNTNIYDFIRFIIYILIIYKLYKCCYKR